MLEIKMKNNTVYKLINIIFLSSLHVDCIIVQIMLNKLAN